MEKLKFAILGYGRMGHVTEQALRERGEIIANIIDHKKYDEWPMTMLLREEAEEGPADCVICFVSPESGYQATKRVLMEGVDIVVGTTKFYLNADNSPNQEMLQEFDSLAKDHECRMMYASNFSMGVQVFWKLAGIAAGLLTPLGYDKAIEERHHNRKVDVSGTAKTAGNILLETSEDKTTLNLGDARRKRAPEEIMIASTRVGHIPGTHTVIFDCPTDTLEIIHRVRDPKIFAAGAIGSGYWLQEQPPGLYEIRDRFSQ